MAMAIGWLLMILGLLIALSSSALLLLGKIESGVAAMIGIIGIGLIASAGRWFPPRPRKQAQSENVVQTIHSPDQKQRALIKLRGDGKYQIEIQELIHHYSPDVGAHDRWERRSNATITDSLASAVEIAARSIGAGTGDFFGDDA